MITWLWDRKVAIERASDGFSATSRTVGTGPDISQIIDCHKQISMFIKLLNIATFSSPQIDSPSPCFIFTFQVRASNLHAKGGAVADEVYPVDAESAHDELELGTFLESQANSKTTPPATARG